MKEERIEQPVLDDSESRTLYQSKRQTPKKNLPALLALLAGVGSLLPFVMLFVFPSTVVFALVLSFLLSIVGIVLSIRSRKVSIHIFSTIGFICSVVVLCVTVFIFVLTLSVLI